MCGDGRQKVIFGFLGFCPSKFLGDEQWFDDLPKYSDGDSLRSSTIDNLVAMNTHPSKNSYVAFRTFMQDDPTSIRR
jgi:hypothetical protein